jgi:hypothetical protein
VHISPISRMRLAGPTNASAPTFSLPIGTGRSPCAAAARGAGVSTVAARQLFLCFAAIYSETIPCPDWSPELTEAACQSLAAISGKRYAGSVASSVFPKRCYWNTITDGVYYNPDPDGQVYGGQVFAFVRSICSVGSAPTSRRTARVCAGGWQRGMRQCSRYSRGTVCAHVNTSVAHTASY